MRFNAFFTSTLIWFCVVQTIRTQDDYDNNNHDASIPKKNKKSLRIVGGTTVQPHFFPATVIMTVGGYFSCGGTILNDEWVLSAANCVNSTDPEDYEFLAGRHDRSKQEASEQKVSAIEVFVHKDYTETFQNDIAIFKVSPKFTFNDKVKAVILPPKDWNKKGNSWAVGWGKTAQQNDKGSTTLQKVALPIIPNDKCEDLMGYIYDTNICAGTVNGGKDACPGDAGGPLYFKDQSTWLQVGIVSWGDGCGKRGKVGVYTRISKYLDWIKDKTGVQIG